MPAGPVLQPAREPPGTFVIPPGQYPFQLYAQNAAGIAVQDLTLAASTPRR